MITDTPILLAVELTASLTSVVGVSAGVVGVAAAVYLQLVATNRCSPVYIGLFFAIGAGMILVNYGAFELPLYGAGIYLPVIGNLLILTAELYLFRWVQQRTAVCNPTEILAADDHEA